MAATDLPPAPLSDADVTALMAVGVSVAKGG